LFPIKRNAIKKKEKGRGRYYGGLLGSSLRNTQRSSSSGSRRFLGRGTTYFKLNDETMDMTSAVPLYYNLSINGKFTVKLGYGERFH
jgi:hypothetical protein